MQEAAFSKSSDLHQLSLSFYSGGLSQENPAASKKHQASLWGHCPDQRQVDLSL